MGGRRPCKAPSRRGECPREGAPPAGGDHSQIRLSEALTQRASFKQETGGATAGHTAGGVGVGHSLPRHAHCVCPESVWLNPGLLPRGVPGRAKTSLCVAEKSFICHRDIVH